MVRSGVLCKNCRANKCVDTDVQISCPDCNETGCEKCDGLGYFEIEGCPQKLMTRDTREILKLSEWVEKGYLPTTGGLLDQSASFLEHCEFYQDEKNRADSEKYK